MLKGGENSMWKWKRPDWIGQRDNIRRRSLLQRGCHENLAERASPSEELVWANGCVQSCCIASSSTTKSKNCCWYFNCQHAIWRLVRHKESWRANLRPALICSTKPPCRCKARLMYTRSRQATQVQVHSTTWKNKAKMAIVK